MPASETTSAGSPAGSALARQKVLQAAGYKVALVTQVGGAAGVVGPLRCWHHNSACLPKLCWVVGHVAGTHSCFQHHVRIWR